MIKSTNLEEVAYHINITDHILKFKQPAGTSRGVYTTRKSYYLELSSDEKPGIKGIGECATLPDLSCDALPNYVEVLERVCQSFCHEGKIPYEYLRDYPSILFGLETAYLQYLKNGSPALFDTPFSEGKEGIPINGLIWMGSFEEMYDRVRAKLESGFRCVKLKIGAIAFEEELQLLKFIRSHFSKNDVELRVDANGAFKVSEALQRLYELSKYDIHSIEQPIRSGQWNDMALLCKNTPIPIALDEELIGVNAVFKKELLLDMIQPHYIVLKPSLHGGMKGVEEWILLAKKRNVGSWITSALESNIGLNSIAQLTAKLYGPEIKMPQGLGTGQLFVENISMPIEIKGDKLWFLTNS